MTNNKIFLPKLNFQILQQRETWQVLCGISEFQLGFARFNDETQQGRNCPKLVTNSQERIFQFFATLSCRWLLRQRRNIFSFSGGFCSGTHWKFISGNNMSLNCKIGMAERVCTVINRLDSSNADVRASRCVRKNKHGCTGRVGGQLAKITCSKLWLRASH